MEKRRMGRHWLEVPALCLGTMTFGLQVDEKLSRSILDKAVDNRLTFLDTADAYPLGGDLSTLGDTEAIIGRWMKDKGNREDLIVATKCFAPTRRGLNNAGLSRQHIMESIDNSLRRLQTDYVDLYQSHGFDPNTPMKNHFVLLKISSLQARSDTWAVPTTPRGDWVRRCALRTGLASVGIFRCSRATTCSIGI